MAHYADAAVSSHESAGGVCAFARVSRHVYLFMSISVYAGLYTHLCGYMCAYTADLCAYCTVSLPSLAPPAELRIGGDRRIDEIFNCRVLKEQQMLCSAN